MANDKPTKVPRYTTDLLKIPGMSFDVTVTDPKERIQAYLDNYRKAGQTRDEVRLVSGQDVCHPLIFITRPRSN